MTSNIPAVIFDFNGTLFSDTEFHNRAWQDFAERHKKTLTPYELECYVHGHANREILDYLFKSEPKPEESAILSEEKEEIYRNICLQNPEKCILSSGAEEYLNRLKRWNIARTIATASYLKNLEMYFELFSLDRWFDMKNIIYDSGHFRGKPYPDMFLAAAEKIKVPIEQCMIVEDSLGGVQAAYHAGAAQIIAFSNDDNPGKFSQFNFIDQIVTDFRQIDMVAVSLG
ncbi:MAG: HAD family phosphatase [Bacteroidales bacterium]|jgi:beta-phosphoglucomutase-like phosphatase (HAD superfamily)